MFIWKKVCIRQLLTSSEYIPQARHYGRWTHRTPLRTLPSEEDVNIYPAEQTKCNDNDIYSGKVNWKHKPRDANSSNEQTEKLKQVLSKNAVKKDVSYDMIQTVMDSNGEFVYTKLPNKDARMTSLLTKVQSNNTKERKNIILEGKRLIIEALENNCKLEYLLFSRKSDVEEIKSFLPKSGATLYKMPYREIQLWSGLTTSPGIMGIFRKPDPENFIPSIDCIPVTIICDNVREPGNLGAILRTCAGAGCHKIILTRGCVNLWDTKVTRSASGAHFHLNILSRIDWTDIDKQLQPNSRIFMADNKLFSSTSENVEDATFRIENIPLVPYYGIRTERTEAITLIVGGETEGLSESAYKFVYERRGVRLNIPLTTGVDCLNSGVALGIILFEVKKQMLLSVQENENKIHTFG
ncbi:rrna methyltransferase 3 [Holotrichia oblita]|uniref:Rrna methyltransferase 3 n=1 Tax=Holotrichia oblita TaxID=644536 RepID=A0ACB9TYB9_HOLOL|nr:rrna methyltransferase 3 [Holotrichia oblita]